MKRIIVLLYTILVLGFPSVYAQKPQLEVYKDLLTQLNQRLSNGVSMITGDTLAGVAVGINLKKDRPTLELEFPETEYTKIDKRTFKRSVLLNYTLKDSSSTRGSSVRFADTLTVAALKQIRREAPASMRGGAITAFGKLVRAAALVGGSIGLVLVLFRIRS